MARYLVQGDPLIALGPATLIPDGALIVDGAQITDVGPREVLAARGPFDRVLGSAGHFVMPGFVNCHYHSELAIGPGLYQHIFEKANVYIQGAVGPIDSDDLYYGILWGLITAIKGGQTGTVDMSRSGWSAGTRTSTRTRPTRPSWPSSRRTSQPRSGRRRWATPGRSTT